MNQRIALAIATHRRRSLLPEPDVRRELRARVGLTQSVIAGALGVTPPTVSRWEAGATPRGSALTRYLELLALLADEFDDPKMHDAAGQAASSKVADGPRRERAYQG
jgi:transcriptional regulator with XRE-family HTH domain